MATFSDIFARNTGSTNQDQNGLQSPDRIKRDIILRTPGYEVRLCGTHIEVSDGVISQIYGIHNFCGLYLHKDTRLNLVDCYAIAKFVNIYFIDARGNVLGEYKRYKNV